MTLDIFYDCVRVIIVIVLAAEAIRFIFRD